MKKKLMVTILCLSAAMLTACGHEHTFTEATCEAPATCTECKVTEGEALGHKLTEATCKAPATCTECGYTEGEALAHTFTEATCEAPATCTECGYTEGEALAHNFIEATYSAPATCADCGFTDGEPLEYTLEEYYNQPEKKEYVQRTLEEESGKSGMIDEIEANINRNDVTLSFILNDYYEIKDGMEEQAVESMTENAKNMCNGFRSDVEGFNVGQITVTITLVYPDGTSAFTVNYTEE